MNTDLLTGIGGSGGFVVAVAFVVAQVVKSRGERRAQPSGAVTDASTANALLLASLESERDENNRLRARVAAAERRIDELQIQREDDREVHRRELAAVQARLEQFTREATELRRQLAEAQARLERGGM